LSIEYVVAVAGCGLIAGKDEGGYFDSGVARSRGRCTNPKSSCPATDGARATSRRDGIAVVSFIVVEVEVDCNSRAVQSVNGQVKEAEVGMYGFYGRTLMYILRRRGTMEGRGIYSALKFPGRSR
jgi:hypothetical protein